MPPALKKKANIREVVFWTKFSDMETAFGSLILNVNEAVPQGLCTLSSRCLEDLPFMLVLMMLLMVVSSEKFLREAFLDLSVQISLSHCFSIFINRPFLVDSYNAFISVFTLICVITYLVSLSLMML